MTNSNSEWVEMIIQESTSGPIAQALILRALSEAEARGFNKAKSKAASICTYLEDDGCGEDLRKRIESMQPDLEGDPK